MTPEAAKVEAVLIRAVEQTLEQLAFAIVEPVCATAFAEGARNVCWSKLAVSRPFTGEVELKLPRALSAELAGTILAMDVEQDNTEVLLDVLGEMLNTITGFLLKGLVGDDQVFEMGVPSSGTDADYHHVFEEGVLEAAFQLDGLPLLASWRSLDAAPEEGSVAE